MIHSCKINNKNCDIEVVIEESTVGMVGRFGYIKIMHENSNVPKIFQVHPEELRQIKIAIQKLEDE